MEVTKEHCDPKAMDIADEKKRQREAMSIRGTRVSVNGRDVRCRVVHPASELPALTPLERPLLLLHGLGNSADSWGPTLSCLARRGLSDRVIAPDFPGYGRSAAFPETLGINDLADWTTRLMDELGIEQAHVAGNSMGCQVALALARRHPQRVGALVLAGPTVGKHDVRTWRYFVGLFADFLAEPLSFKVLVPRMYLQMGVPRFLVTTGKMRQDDPMDEADAVLAPCLVLRGGRDRIVPEESARRLAAALPGGVFMELAGAAHAIQFNQPENFTQLTVAFLKGTEARAKGEKELRTVARDWGKGG